MSPFKKACEALGLPIMEPAEFLRSPPPLPYVGLVQATLKLKIAQGTRLKIIRHFLNLEDDEQVLDLKELAR